MLNLIVFVCGAALMGLELLAARILAPALGNSIFVWGSVISTVMIALSLGYWAGGHLADRFGSSRTLPPVIVSAGLLTVAAVPISQAVLPYAAYFGPRTGALLASAAIFFAPSLLLAMVSPLGVRLAAESGMERIGRSAGGLYAISTGGSIVGTLATSFWLIPLLSLEPLIVSIGFTLFATAGLAALLPRRYADHHSMSKRLSRSLLLGTLAAAGIGILAGAVLLMSGIPTPSALSVDERVLYRKDSQYHRILVTQDSEQRHLRFDKSHQSSMMLGDPFETTMAYPNYMHLALALKPDATRVLILGLGGGSITKRMWRDYPKMQVDTVEIDPAVVDVAERYFELPKDGRLSVTVMDGRRYLQTTDKTYDVIICDAYYDDALPFHLTTREFFEEAKARLAPGGVLAYNVVSSVEGRRSKLFRSMYRTAGSVWGHLYVFPIGIGTNGKLEENRNIIVLATDAEVAPAELRARMANGVSGRVTLYGFAGFARDLYLGPVRVSDVPLLTDDHAPTDSLIQVN